MRMRHTANSGSVQHYKIFPLYLTNGNNIGKSVPLQAWSGPEGSRK